MLNPELIVSRLFTECLEPNECLVVTGTQQFNAYSGYGDDFKWKGPHNDTLPKYGISMSSFAETIHLPHNIFLLENYIFFSLICINIVCRDTWNRKVTQIVAIDAYNFGNTDEQYKPKFVLRELNKAYVGFCRGLEEIESGVELSAVATGNWGCGVFRGDPRLKFLLQLMACSLAGKEMAYFTFGDGPLQAELGAMYEHLVGLNVTVGKSSLI